MDPKRSKARAGTASGIPEGFTTIVAHGEASGEVKQPRLIEGIGHDFARIIEG